MPPCNWPKRLLTILLTIKISLKSVNFFFFEKLTSDLNSATQKTYKSQLLHMFDFNLIFDNHNSRFIPVCVAVRSVDHAADVSRIAVCKQKHLIYLCYSPIFQIFSSSYIYVDYLGIQIRYN